LFESFFLPNILKKQAFLKAISFAIRANQLLLHVIFVKIWDDKIFKAEDILQTFLLRTNYSSDHFD